MKTITFALSSASRESLTGATGEHAWTLKVAFEDELEMNSGFVRSFADGKLAALWENLGMRTLLRLLPVIAGLLMLPPLWGFLGLVTGIHGECEFFIGVGACDAAKSFADWAVAGPVQQALTSVLAFAATAFTVRAIVARMSSAGKNPVFVAALLMFFVSFVEPVDGVPGFIAFFVGLLVAKSPSVPMLVCWSANIIFVAAVLFFYSKRYVSAAIAGLCATCASFTLMFHLQDAENMALAHRPLIWWTGYGLWVGAMAAIAIAACVENVNRGKRGDSQALP